MKFILAILIFTPSFLIAQQTIRKTMIHNNESREYLIYIPAIYNDSYPTPLMFNFHGFTKNAAYQMYLSEMQTIADTANFIIVYPEGTLLLGAVSHWSVGSWTDISNADDIGFINTTIDSLVKNYNIDSNRIYSCGYSNGGYFSFELACQISEKIAAIGSVSGSMSKETYDACNPSHPTPIITINGTEDGEVSYDGGNPIRSKSLANVNSYWANFNNTTSTVVINLPDIKKYYLTFSNQQTVNTSVELITYSNGKNCTSIEHYKVIKGKHTWPGKWGNMDIKASKLIWDFVSKYDKNGLIGCLLTTESKINKSTIKVFPNPFSEQIIIESDQSFGGKFKIFDVMGKTVFTGLLSSKRNKIDLSYLSPNIYFLETERQIIRIIKQR